MKLALNLPPFTRSLFLVVLLARLTPGLAADPATMLVAHPYFLVTSGLAKGAAFDGSNFLISVQSYFGGPVSAQLLTTNGTPARTATDIGRNGFASLTAFDGTNYLVAWADTVTLPADIYGQFITRSGDKLGVPFLIAEDVDARQLDGLVFDGANYFLVWEADARDTNHISSVEGRFVTPAGTFRDEVLSIAAGTRRQKFPAVAFNGSNHLVGWLAQAEDSDLWNIMGRFVNRDGQMSAPFTINQVAVSNASPIAVAACASNYLAVWSRQVGPFLRRDPIRQTNQWFSMLHGRLISADGTFPTNEVRLATGKGGQTFPALASDGTNFFLSWLDGRHVPTLPDLFYQQLRGDGTPDAPGFRYFLGMDPVAPTLLFAGNKYLSLYLTGNTYGNFLTDRVPVPPTLRNVARHPDGLWEADLTGDPRGTHTLEVSTNLINWQPWGFDFGYGPVRPRHVGWQEPSANGSGRGFFRAVEGSYSCINNLRAIHQAKDRWALEEDHGNNEVMSPDDLFGAGKYLPFEPVCPNGGTYYLETLYPRPTCSLGGVAGHTL